MSISPISSSMRSAYAQYATSSTSSTNEEDSEYAYIIAQLQAMGITPSRDNTVDKLKLDTVKKAQQMMQSQSSSSSKQSIPFEDVMNTLNLQVTGDLDKDYQTTIDKLDYEIDLSSSDENKKYYQALKDQVENEYNSSKQSSVSNFSGANQLAAMNRLMLGL